MAQKPTVMNAVAGILETSGRTDAELPIGFTHRALAARVYNTDAPTASQLSSVRRAVARLVADGRAERGKPEPWWMDFVAWRVDLPAEPTHVRASTNAWGETWERTAHNPGGITVFRTPTDEDRAAREAWEQSPAGQSFRQLKVTA